MFILRRITLGGNEFNTLLNQYYNLITKERNKEEFEKTAKIWSEDIDLSDDAWIYAFIVYNEGKDLMPLYKESTYYIMTSDGKTFSNITLR